MRTSLDHLPEGKRRELAHIVQALRDGFAWATERRSQPHLRRGKLLKVILFGSYARGDWVEDPVGRYYSDYDLLVVVDHEDLTDVSEFWEKTETRFLEELSAGEVLRTPVGLIYHSLADVNEKLSLGRYFFMDILRDGIVLFEEPGYPFVEPTPLSPEQALAETRDYFEEWFESADDFLESATDALAKGKLKLAAFLLHQATERYYHCLFLVRTLYSPKTHNLNRLRDITEALEPSLKQVWPRDTRFQKRCFSLLRDAYVKARYSRSYVITGEQLEWISERVAMLQTLVREACEQRIDTLAKAA
ncbi:HEPN domain-containing protein [Sphingomonas sp. G-3-2-10]|uniref:HEPN domain-containing protein n=1 Tax=Sphingomonas sp. G-3-2-10 TaxID=2728838 RepID=UPI00146CA206|nr:HEPN domain-containing protein [Sphingomonas sp. G-3-2-10]NML05962.1 HEPN domain-containing protein [Sphingomonas sp. G-3-2-10]